jgi:hypothetical protein
MDEVLVPDKILMNHTKSLNDALHQMIRSFSSYGAKAMNPALHRHS